MAEKLTEHGVENIEETIKERAPILGVPPDMVGFNILNREISKDPTGNLRAKYDIELFVKEKDDPLENIISIQFDEEYSPRKAFIYVDTRKLDDTVEINNERVLEIIKRKLALSSVIAGVKENIFEAVARTIKERLLTKSRPFKILIAEQIEPENGLNSKLVKYFKEFSKVGSVKGTRIDFKEKNIVAPVKKGQLLLEYYKPTVGKEGYTIFGRLIPQTVGQVIDKLDLAFDPDSVEIEEDKRKIKYIAKKDGSLIYKNGIYSIDTGVTLDRVDVTTTGNIDGDKNIDLSIGRGTRDEIEDTVAQGMKVVGKNVVVNGDVGSEAVIEAENVKIHGNLSPDAVVRAKNVYVAKCRGIVEAENVEIDLAERAQISATKKATINKCLASKILATSLEIKEEMISSNVTTSSGSVIIGNLTGTNNTISIKPLELPWIQTEYAKLLGQREALSGAIKELKMRIENSKNTLVKEASSYKRLLEMLQELKDENKEIPKAILVKIQNYKELQKALKEEKKELNSLLEEYKEVLKRIEDMKYSYRKGYVIIKGKLEKLNKFVFNDLLSRVIEYPQESVKIYPRVIRGEEKLVIEPFDH